MRSNVAAAGAAVLTREGGPGIQFGPLKELRRSVLSALLFEDAFYESGADHAKRIRALVAACQPADVAALAVEARDVMYLRHVPLFLVRELARVKGNGAIVADTLERVIQRPDELTEYLALYWKDAKDAPLSAGSKRGLARAFGKFKAHTLAKYDRDNAFKLRDVLRLTHAKPKDAEQSAVWKAVVKRELETPDTWETELSAGKNKREVFERLLLEQKLGGLAFLRNLRNMVEAGVDTAMVRGRFAGSFDKVLPFRFIAAVRHAPAFAQDLNDAMLRVTAALPRLSGRTVVLVDVSGSMNDKLSSKSEVTRMDVAAGLAVLAKELVETRVFTFSNKLVEVANYRGLPMVSGILTSQAHGGTELGAAVRSLNQMVDYDRLIVITDEQSSDAVPAPKGRGYMINVAANKHGVGEGAWARISGWSERTLDYIRAVEADT